MQQVKRRQQQPANSRLLSLRSSTIASPVGSHRDSNWTNGSESSLELIRVVGRKVVVTIASDCLWIRTTRRITAHVRKVLLQRNRDQNSSALSALSDGSRAGGLEQLFRQFQGRHACTTVTNVAIELLS